MTIAGSDSSGGAGIQADIKTFAALGVHGTCVITSVTSQTSNGVQSVHDLPLDVIVSQLRSIMDDVDVRYAKIGMLHTPEIIKTVAEELRRRKTPLVVDPVMYAEAGGVLLKEEAIPELIEEIFPLADIITPNVLEATILSNIEIEDLEDAKKAAISLGKITKSVIITGGHLNGVDILYDGEFRFINGDLIDKKKLHGTGCTYSAAIAAELAKGYAFYDAAVNAHRFVREAILHSKHKVDQTAKLILDSDRYHVLEDVKEAVERIKRCESFIRLIPEVGCNIGMATVGARDRDDIVSVNGRIVKGGIIGCVWFGASDHVARIILSMIGFHPEMRSCINIRYAPDILSACEESGMRIANFERKDEPEGVNTMEWGVEKAIRSFKGNGIPDVIYDEGGMGKEAMIRIFGRTAREVAIKAIKISEMVSES